MPLPGSDEARWEKRIERARALAEEYPSASQALTFYCEIASFQKALAAALKPPAQNGKDHSAEGSLKLSLDLAPLLPGFPALLSLVKEVGTPVLADAADELSQAGPEYWEALLREYWRPESRVLVGTPETHLFFANAFLQPFAEHLARTRPLDLPRFGKSTCPVCGSKPVAGVLREEGHGGKRSLVCSFCFTEWGFHRLMCPSCGEEEFNALPVYTASQFEHVRVEACDTCKTYLKTVDLTKNGLAIPEVDELAALPLGLWAAENGYTKFQPNLLGL